MTDFLHISRAILLTDAKYQQQGGNGRKVVVAEVYQQTEHLAQTPAWIPGAVIESKTHEVSFFNQNAGQDRHFHLTTTEVYTVTFGEMIVRLNDEPAIVLKTGDTLIVEPETVHQIFGASFEATVVAIGPNLGPVDKFVQLEQGADWSCWADLSPDKRKSAYKL